MDSLLETVEAYKKVITSLKEDFIQKFNKVQKLLELEEDYNKEVNEYVQIKEMEFATCLLELEDLEFRIHELNIESENEDSTNTEDTSSIEEEIKSLRNVSFGNNKLLLIIVELQSLDNPVGSHAGCRAKADKCSDSMSSVPPCHHLLDPGVPLLLGDVSIHQQRVHRGDDQNGPWEHEGHPKS